MMTVVNYMKRERPWWAAALIVWFLFLVAGLAGEASAEAFFGWRATMPTDVTGPLFGGLIAGIITAASGRRAKRG